MAGSRSRELFDEQKKKANRRIEYNVLHGQISSSLSGMQGLKKFYVRVQLKDNEARGMTILYDQAMEGIMQPVVVAMSSAFAPFGESSERAGLAQGGIRDRHRRQHRPATSSPSGSAPTIARSSRWRGAAMPSALAEDKVRRPCPAARLRRAEI